VNIRPQLTLDEFLALYAAGPDVMWAIFEELSTRYTDLDKRVTAAEARNTALQLKVNELTARLDKDSHNSNKPPSSDGLRKPPAPTPASLRKRSGRKPGGQAGHSGSTLEYREKPDDEVEHRLEFCDGCSYDLSGVETVVDETRQVFDVPSPPELKCTQHNCHCTTCPRCGKVCRGRFPAHITSEVQYGENIAATVVYLVNYQFLPYKRTVELTRSLFNVSLSQGTVYNMCSRADYALEDVSEKIQEALIKSSLIHCDESGIRVCGMLYWLHLISNKYFTAYSCQKRRGKPGMEEMGILNEYKGRAVHDGWLPYFLFACAHALCNVHHIRELVAAFENFQQTWAKDMIEVLLDGNEAVKSAVAEGKTHLSDYMLKKLNDRYDAAITAGLEVNPSLLGARPGRKKNTKRGALVRRLQRDKAETLAFLYNFEIPFDNNLAERDIRMIKAKQKISGCFRSLDGAEMFCRIRGYLSTMQKQGFDLFEAIRSVCRLDPIQPHFSSA
jgi:transposase